MLKIKPKKSMIHKRGFKRVFTVSKELRHILDIEKALKINTNRLLNTY